METLIVPAVLDSLKLISEFITGAARQVGLSDHDAWQLELAVDEAATNIMLHGYDPAAPGEIQLAWQMDGGQLVVTMRDFGRRFSPGDVPAPDLDSPLEERRPGGLGLFLMHQLMDRVIFDFDEDHGNLLTMIKRLEAPGPTKVFELSGRLDASTTPAAVARITTAITGGARAVLIDMSKVTFMSSSGLRALLLLRKQLLANEGELRLCALQPQVYEVFELTGFKQVFTIDVSRDQSLRSFTTHEP